MKKPKLKKDSWLALRLPEIVNSEFKRIAALNGTTMSRVTLKLITGYIGRHKKKEG